RPAPGIGRRRRVNWGQAPRSGRARATKKRALIWLGVCAVLLPMALTVVRVHPQLVRETSLGDTATEEMAVIEAAHGARTVGPWSRYGFFQPGPLLFYLLTPGYLAAGSHFEGIAAGAFVLSWLSVMTVLLLCAYELEPWAATLVALPLLGGVVGYLRTGGAS